MRVIVVVLGLAYPEYNIAGQNAINLNIISVDSHKPAVW